MRAVEQWRQIVANLQMIDVRAQVALSLMTEFEDQSLALHERRDDELSKLFDQLVDLTARLP